MLRRRWDVGSLNSLSLSATAAASKFIICRRASSCRVVQGAARRGVRPTLAPESYTFNCICGPIIEFLLVSKLLKRKVTQPSARYKAARFGQKHGDFFFGESFCEWMQG